MFISVRNWRRFQHYTDRNPPWIKNYTDLLKDDAYLDLSPHRRAVLHGLWLVYASVKARPKLDARSLSRRLELKVTKADIEALISAGFIELTESPEMEEPKWASRYISDELRERVLDRFDRKCALCHSPDNLEIDHITPISKGGTSDEENLRVLCRPCNRKLHNTESVSHLSSTGLASVTTETETEEETKTETPQAPLNRKRKTKTAVDRLELMIRNGGYEYEVNSLLDAFHTAGINGAEEQRLLELAHSLRDDPDQDIPL